MNRQSLIARCRQSMAENPPLPRVRHDWQMQLPTNDAKQFGEQWARFGATWDQTKRLLLTSDIDDKDVTACATGFFGGPPAVHFVGFKDSGQFHRAQAVFGPPDFIHRHWDNRAVHGGELAPHDIVVFARGDDQQKVAPFSFDDSAVM